MRSLPITESPPMCECGCEEPVEPYIHGKKWRWKRFVRKHQYRCFKPIYSPEVRKAFSDRMKRDNPMKNPETVEKVMSQQRGRKVVLSEEGRKRLVAASRKRMLTNNPMKDPEIALKVHKKNLARAEPTPNEVWAQEIMPSLKWVANGALWIAQRNPDFTAGMGRVVEVSGYTIFNGGAPPVKRAVEGYGLDSIRHYRAEGWECLVVFLPAQRQKNQSRGAWKALQWFSRGGGSAAYRTGKLYVYDANEDAFGSTISMYETQKRT